MATSAPVKSAAPTTSGRPAERSRVSGTTRAPATSETSAIGTLIRNTVRQLQPKRSALREQPAED